MPSLIRFLTIAGTLFALVYGGFYVLATHFEPSQTEVEKRVRGVSIKGDP